MAFQVYNAYCEHIRHFEIVNFTSLFSIIEGAVKGDFSHCIEHVSSGMVLIRKCLGLTMWLWYDWQAAAIAEPDGRIIDQVIFTDWYDWDDDRAVKSVLNRLKTIASGGLTKEAAILQERFAEAKPRPHGSPDLPDSDWPSAPNDSLWLVDQAALLLAEHGVAEAAGDADRRLEHLHRASEEMRSTALMMESRLIEWVGLFLPKARFDTNRSSLARDVAQAEGMSHLAHQLGLEAPEIEPETSEWRSIRDWAESLTQFQSRLDRLEASIRTIAAQHIPSVSALLGPLLATRMCVSAHGLTRLARLPAGTVQVLGAEKAFFHHLKTGADPPKHGHLFMHPWISRSPYWVRGKIARTLAAKVSIAARIDAAGGEPWGEEQVEDMDEKVMQIKQNHPAAPRKKKGARR